MTDSACGIGTVRSHPFNNNGTKASHAWSLQYRHMVLVFGLSSSYFLRKLLQLAVDIDYCVPQNVYLYMTPHAVGFMSAKSPGGSPSEGLRLYILACPKTMLKRMIAEGNGRPFYKVVARCRLPDRVGSFRQSRGEIQRQRQRDPPVMHVETHRMDFSAVVKTLWKSVTYCLKHGVLGVCIHLHRSF